ncbi:MAG: ABC transporter ATP-binding protein, partial [Eggerthellaceae bacterium]|nr:ABC transporter ATP-binding protein [Eggerthellaceae bacterium]
VYGIMGTNGSGKSTILKIIAGVLEPTRGKCTIHGKIAPLIELGAGFDLELTARENIYLNGALLGYSKKFIDQNFDEIVEFSEVSKFLDMPMKNYSSGMVARIAFAIATIMVPDILIVDEVLSVGDFMFRQKCERRIQELIRDHGVTVLIVSHSNEQVRRLCNKAIWIEKGHTRMIGTAEDVCRIYQLVGGRTGCAESEKVIMDTFENTDVNTSCVQCNAIYGDTKFGTSAKMAQAEQGHVDTVVYTPSEDHVQSLIATGLASALGAKMLTCAEQSVPDVTRQALEQLTPDNAIFVSCTLFQNPQKIAADLPKAPAHTHVITEGTNTRLSLAVFEFGRERGIWGDTCVISPEFCVGDQFAILPAATKLSAPLFFTSKKTVLDRDIIDVVKAHFKRALVLAGEEAINEGHLAPLRQAGVEIVRFIADNEHEANERIFDWLEEERIREGAGPVERLVVVNPRHPDDAFCVGNYAARNDALILLNNPSNLDYVASAIRQVQRFGGSIRTLDFVGDPSIFSDLDKTILHRIAASARLDAANGGR